VFKIDNSADVCGTSLQTYATASYARLVELFGTPAESDGYKVSGEWSFTDSNGLVVTVYDYKETSLYDSGYPTVEEFRTLPSYEWHIGAQDRVTAERFKRWLENELKTG
jgi:hypothetical protein